MRTSKPVAARITPGARWYWRWGDPALVRVASLSGWSSARDGFSRAGEDEWKPVVFKNIVHTRVLAEQDWLRFQAEIHGFSGRNQSQ
jgi:hypothetical protein